MPSACAPAQHPTLFSLEEPGPTLDMQPEDQDDMLKKSTCQTPEITFTALLNKSTTVLYFTNMETWKARGGDLHEAFFKTTKTGLKLLKVTEKKNISPRLTLNATS